jgi:hypothetical protein
MGNFFFVVVVGGQDARFHEAMVKIFEGGIRNRAIVYKGMLRLPTR